MTTETENDKLKRLFDQIRVPEPDTAAKQRAVNAALRRFKQAGDEKPVSQLDAWKENLRGAWAWSSLRPALALAVVAVLGLTFTLRAPHFSVVQQGTKAVSEQAVQEKGVFPKAGEEALDHGEPPAAPMAKLPAPAPAMKKSPQEEVVGMGGLESLADIAYEQEAPAEPAALSLGRAASKAAPAFKEKREVAANSVSGVPAVMSKSSQGFVDLLLHHGWQVITEADRRVLGFGDGRVSFYVIAPGETLPEPLAGISKEYRVESEVILLTAPEESALLETVHSWLEEYFRSESPWAMESLELKIRTFGQ